VRLAVFAGFLAGLFYLVAVMRIIDVEDVRRTVSATGPVAPLTYVVVSAVLGAIFVPGPLLAAGSGVLFGPVLGTFVTLGATVGTATIASLAGRRAGRDSCAPPRKPRPAGSASPASIPGSSPTGHGCTVPGGKDDKSPVTRDCHAGMYVQPTLMLNTAFGLLRFSCREQLLTVRRST
jgi:hypothetical protein